MGFYDYQLYDNYTWISKRKRAVIRSFSADARAHQPVAGLSFLRRYMRAGEEIRRRVRKTRKRYQDAEENERGEDERRDGPSN